MSTAEERFWKALEKSKKEFDKRFERLEKKHEEAEEARRKADEAQKKMSEDISRITDGWGRFVEGIVSPSAVKIFREMGYEVFGNYHRRKVRRNGQVVAEFDTILITEKDGRNVLIIGETKAHCSSNDVKDFINTLKRTEEYLKEYKGYEIIGFVAGINYTRGTDKFASRNGLFVLKPSGETMVLDIPEGFKPKNWTHADKD